MVPFGEIKSTLGFPGWQGWASEALQHRASAGRGKYPKWGPLASAATTLPPSRARPRLPSVRGRSVPHAGVLSPPAPPAEALKIDGTFLLKWSVCRSTTRLQACPLFLPCSLKTPLNRTFLLLQATARLPAQQHLLGAAPPPSPPPSASSITGPTLSGKVGFSASGNQPASEGAGSARI